MADHLINVLEQLCDEVIRQGSLGKDEEYPELFITYWNNSSEEAAHYDNVSHAELEDYDVNVYGSDPDEVYSKLNQVKEALKKAGYVIYDSGHDVVSDVETHIGRGIGIERRR